MNEIPYFLIEAFASKPFTGNPAAVCLLKEKLSHTTMQNIATQFNLSETAFVLPVSQGYDIRWFTPLCEVNLCGHGTLASAQALWASGVSENTIHFHSKGRQFRCAKTSEGVELEFPKYDVQALKEPEAQLKELFPEAVSFSLADKNLIVEMKDATEVISFEPAITLFKALSFRGIYVTSKSMEPAYDFVSRCFFPNEGIPEDPVTGSAHCYLGPYWAEKLAKKKLIAFQASARSGVLGVEVLPNSVLLTGRARIFATGSIKLNAFLGER